MRQANQAIIRERRPIPTLEKTLHELSGATVFSSLDLKQGKDGPEHDTNLKNVFLAPQSKGSTMTSACLVLLYLQMASPQKRRKSKPSKMPANLQTLQKSEVFSVSLTTALVTFLTLPPSLTRLDS